MILNKSNFFPCQKNPYYINVSSFHLGSAGVRVLYMLCHHLNLKGYKAYIVKNSPLPHHLSKEKYLAPDLNTTISKFYDSQKITPIYVYPESIKGNPYNASCIARYVLFYPGLLWGDKTFVEEEIVFAYSKALVNSVTSHNAELLYMPACDPNIFYPPKSLSVKRTKRCVYLGKYTDYFGGKPFDITKNCLVITRDKPDSLSQEQMADLFRESEILYVYEDTSVATEATMCGCPVVFIPNDFMKGPPLALKETAKYGIAWGLDEKEINYAKETVHLAFDNYLESLKLYEEQLDNFIKLTQEKVSKIPFSNHKKNLGITIHNCLICRTINFIRLSFFYINKKGIYNTFLKISNYFSWQHKK